jgi:hypothetical protein
MVDWESHTRHGHPEDDDHQNHETDADAFVCDLGWTVVDPEIPQV